MSSVTFYGMLTGFAWFSKRLPRWVRMLVVVVNVVIVLLVGLSRVYLRVHFASDVIGGYLAGIIWLSVCLSVINRIKRRNRSAGGALFGGGIPGKQPDVDRF